MKESPSAPTPLLLWLASVVVSACRSRTKTLEKSLSSALPRLSAADPNATNRPSAEIEGKVEAPSAPTPPVAWLTSVVVPACRSRTNTSGEVVVVGAAEVVGARPERDEAPVGRDRGEGGGAVGAEAGDLARERGCAGLEVAHEDIGEVVVVGAAEVVGARLERHEAPVGRDRGGVGAAVAGDAVGLVHEQRLSAPGRRRARQHEQPKQAGERQRQAPSASCATHGFDPTCCMRGIVGPRRVRERVTPAALWRQLRFGRESQRKAEHPLGRASRCASRPPRRRPRPSPPRSSSSCATPHPLRRTPEPRSARGCGRACIEGTKRGAPGLSPWGDAAPGA